MNKHLCSLHLIPEPGQESEAHLAQTEAWPHAACHDGVHKAFASTHPLETGVIKAYEWVDGEGKPLEGDSKVWAMAQVMATDHPPIHDYQSNWSNLFKHPAHRLWCAKYEDQLELFQSDLVSMREMISKGMPEALSLWEDGIQGKTYDQIPNVMLGLIRALGV